MNQVPDNANRPASDDETVARLLRLAGHRPTLPEWDAAVVKRAAKDEWRRKVRSRARRTLVLRAGGLLAAAVLALVLGLRLRDSSPAPQEAPPAATIEAIMGSVRVLPPPGGEDRKTIFAGTVVETSGDRAALRLAGGAALRLDADTRLELVSAAVLSLDRGAVYLDSGPEGGAGGVEVRTPLGVARDVGTQFEVRYEPAGALRIRVREGAVDLGRGDGSERAAAGDELVVDADGAVARGQVPGFGPGWDWVLESAPAFAIEGRPLRELLDWFAREGGRELRFAGAAAAELAATSILHGSIAGSAPEQGMASLLRSNGLTYRFDGGELIVSSTDEN
jgi:hypothetical protein